MRALPRRIGCLALGALLSAGCATSYVPQSNGRIALVSDGFGGPLFVRDGVTYRAGPFGGDVDEAVAGNPRAEAEAATYQSMQTTGTILTFVGAAATLAGLVMLPPAATSTRSDPYATPLAVTFGGLVVEVIGLIVAVSGRSHLWDAINMYNDDVALHQGAPCRPLPGVAPVAPASP